MIIKYYKYHLPFAAPLQTSKMTFKNREGIFIECITDEFQCYGEAAPLPGYSIETLDDVLQILSDTRDTLDSKLDTPKNTEWLQEFYKEKNIPASLQFGLDSIAYQIQAYRTDKNFKEYLFPEAPNKIPVNALTSLQSKDYLEETDFQMKEGFQTIKYKVGINFELELYRLQKIRSHFPKLTIRLDANQAWSLEEASRNCRKLEKLNIEYCEEPLYAPTAKNFEVLTNNTKLPLALDETLYQDSDWPLLLSYTSCIILKPMILGSFTKNFETKHFANTHDNKAVFTTSLESSIGRRITAIIASGKGTSQVAHGLNTGKLLAKDVYSDTPCISNGFYHLGELQDQSEETSYDLQEVSSKLF